MDELDGKLIGFLQTDGRMTNAALARNVGVSEGTVRRRVHRLIESKSITVFAVPDLTKLGLHISALIGIQVSPDAIDDVSQKLTALRETEYVGITTGAYDIFLSVSFASSQDLAKFLKDKVGRIPGIRRTETFVNLVVRKRQYSRDFQEVRV